MKATWQTTKATRQRDNESHMTESHMTESHMTDWVDAQDLVNWIYRYTMWGNDLHEMKILTRAFYANILDKPQEFGWLTPMVAELLDAVDGHDTMNGTVSWNVKWTTSYIAKGNKMRADNMTRALVFHESNGALSALPYDI
eukprot:gene2076-18259_t